MMPITDFLSCTRAFDEFESLSPAQRHHAKTYATDLVAASNKTVTGIAREVLPANERVIESVTYEAAGCGRCVQHKRNPARCGFGRRLLECGGYGDSPAVRTP